MISTALAPIAPFTAEEIWEALPGGNEKEQSVHLARFETLNELPEDPRPARPAWERLTRLREEVAVVLEGARREKTIGSSLEGAIALTADSALRADRDATGDPGRGARRPLHRFGSSGRGDASASARPESAPEGAWTASQVYPGLSIAVSQGPRTPLRPVLARHPRSGSHGTLRPVPQVAFGARGRMAKILAHERTSPGSVRAPFTGRPISSSRSPSCSSISGRRGSSPEASRSISPPRSSRTSST